MLQDTHCQHDLKIVHLSSQATKYLHSVSCFNGKVLCKYRERETIIHFSIVSHISLENQIGNSQRFSIGSFERQAIKLLMNVYQKYVNRKYCFLLK
jgi:hypothetical protein